MFGAPNKSMDLLIHIGEVSCCAYGCKPKEVWRVNEDGEIRDTFRKLTKVFAMTELFFFSHYTEGKKAQDTTKYAQFHKIANNVYKKLRDVPFSNGWIAKYLHDKLPLNSTVHLGIVSTYFVWNKFQLDPSIEVICNQGGFGIDGNLSTLLGASFANPDKLYFCFLGDLAFFYDINALGNRHIGRNVRILLVNNGKGVIFRKPGNFAHIFGEEADNYIAAGGHYGNQSKVLVKNFAENLGFTYSSASTKEEFEKLIPTFISPELSEKPILFEVFVSTQDEIQGDDIKEHAEPSGSKRVVKSIIGEKLYSSIKDIIHKNRKGGMTVDVGHN
jgi:2-succinyl-5-enolpyruvyl-6-hydroxy-3-cyclohexene-1-carboxylate synthase